MISTETIEQVKAKTDIVAVIGAFVKLKKKGSDLIGLCPFHNEKTPSFTVSPAKAMFKCFGCGRSGDAVAFLMEQQNKTYPEAIAFLAEKIGIAVNIDGSKKDHVKPVPRLEKIGKKALQWFEMERKISNNTLLRFHITEANEWMLPFEKEVPAICFNYFRNGELVNIKFRGPKKSFKLAKDAELIFYNLDSLEAQGEAIIVEGEIDCLSLHEAGIFNAVSVPNGAGTGNQQLEYLNSCWRSFEGKTKIILATDNDLPGNKLRDELCRRLGIERCFQVEYPEGCKDMNDVLVKFGKEAVVKIIDEAKPWPIMGILTMGEIMPTVEDWYENGYPTGAKTRIPGLDALLTFGPGQITTVTGIPGHGKDEFSNWIMSSLAEHEGWPWGVLGFEESPAETVTKLAEKIAQKAFAHRKDLSNRMNRRQFESAVSLIDRLFYMINPDEIEGTIDSILVVASQLVTRYGIKGLYINPWNWIEHNRPEKLSETEYVSLAYGKIIKWARRHSAHVILLAHTTKIAKDKNDKFIIPTLYSISGSANFFNKTHNGITVYRDYQRKIVDVYVQKVKQSWYGQQGWVSFKYDTMTRQYEFHSTSVTEFVKENLPPGNFREVTEAEKSEMPF